MYCVCKKWPHKRYVVPSFKQVKPEDSFNQPLFHEVDMVWAEWMSDWEKDRQWAFFSNLGSITVLDRMTGFGWRDIETGYRDPEGKFWLASGMYDVRKSGVKTIGEAIEWIKQRANNCVGI